MVKVYDWFGGKSTFFAFWFFVNLVILAYLGKLTALYVGSASSIELLVMMRSIATDYHDRNTTTGGSNGAN